MEDTTEVQANIPRLYSKLNEFREGDRYCDVEIRVDEESFKCHRLILAASCEYFDAMFGGNFKESGTEQITLQGIDASAFAEVMRFAYTGKVIVTAENAYSLIVASEFLKLSFIEELCVEYINRKIPIRNAVNIFIFARTTMKHSLTNVMCEYIIANFLTVSKTAEFLDLPYDEFRLLLDQYRGSKFKSGNNDSSLDVIMRWVDHAREERTLHLHDLMGTVDFKSVSSGYVQFMVKKFFGATSSASSADLVEFASRSAPWMHVFVRPYEDSSENQWGIFSLINPDDEWRYNVCTSRNTDNTTRFRMGSKLNCAIRNVSLGDSLYGLTYHNQRSPVQKFYRASAIFLEQDLHVLKSPPVTVESFEMCASQNDIYLCKHMIFSGTPGHDCYRYNRELDEWFAVPPLRRSLNYACITADRNLIYVIGSDFHGSGHLQAYDSRTSVWQELCRNAQSFSGAATCTHEGKIYVSGGIREPNRLDIFDPVGGKWQPGAFMTIRRQFHRMVSYKGCIWTIGMLCDEICEEYDPVTQDWRCDIGLHNGVAKSIDQRTMQFFGSKYYDEYSSSWISNQSMKVQDAVVF